MEKSSTKLVLGVKKVLSTLFISLKTLGKYFMNYLFIEAKRKEGISELIIQGHKLESGKNVFRTSRNVEKSREGESSFQSNKLVSTANM